MSDKEINILLLGEIGVGKSTFINAFTNYISYETLEEALNGQTICVIPTQFVISDENLKSHSVKYGDNNSFINENECFEKKGQSSTQTCGAYTFKSGKRTIRLIDTPGFGDTRGIEQDNNNLEKILSVIANYKELHLICILLKPNLQTLTTNFVYCLKQLVCHLHKEASNNIVFVFTNTRQTSYRPKNTLVLLREVLNEIKTNLPFVEIPIQKKTMYCLDNDSIQFLIAVRNGIKFDDKEREKFTQNWIQSVKEWNRLINYIFYGKDGHPLKPYSIQDMLSIKEICYLIETLKQPIEEITKKLLKDILKIKNIIREIENSGENNEELIQLIVSSKYEFKVFWWDYIPIVGSLTLPIKLAKHMESINEIKIFKEHLADETKFLEFKNRILNKLNHFKEEYLMEKQTIVKASAKFAIFLKNNSITTYFDSYKEYIQAQIENFKLKTPHNKKCQDNINSLIKSFENTLNEYEREKEIVENDIESVNEEESLISFENINKLIQQLYDLEISGEPIKKLHKQNKTTRNEQGKKEEQLSGLAHLSSSIIDGIKNLFNFH